LITEARAKGTYDHLFYFYSREHNSIAAFHCLLYVVRRIDNVCCYDHYYLATPSGVLVGDAPLHKLKALKIHNKSNKWSLSLTERAESNISLNI